MQAALLGFSMRSEQDSGEVCSLLLPPHRLALWSQCWGQNLSQMQTLHPVDRYRAEERKEAWKDPKETKERKEPQGSSGEPRPGSERAGAEALEEGPA